MFRWSATLAAFLSAFLAVASAPAEEEERKLSRYEVESLERALKEVDGELEPNPKGKRIESIEVVTLDVIEDRDPAPRFLNIFHATTRPYVIEREILLRPGDVYDKSLVRESERNLRFRQISVVLIRPIKGSSPERIRLLVVTKDVWSLRINSEPQIVNGKLRFLAVQPAEENLFGTHKIINGRIVLTRPNYSLGLGFVDRRVAGSRLQAAGNANVVFNCRTNDVEGTFGGFSYGKPLFSTRTRWSWGAAVGWSNVLVRPGGTSGESICSGGRSALLDFAETPGVDNVPYEYRQDLLQSQFSATRSFGVFVKNDITFGLRANRRAFSVGDLSAFEPVVREQFRRRLVPRDDTQLGPFIQLHAYRNRFLRVIDFETLGLQEDHQLGHDVWLRLYPASADLGSTRTLLGLFSGVGYTLPISDGLWRNYVSSRIELSTLEESDAQVVAGTRFVTPRTAIGRLHYDAQVLHRYQNFLNPLVALGGTGRLRGYRESAFVGSDRIVSNLEFRGRPLEILSVQVAGVLFWDAGDAFSGFDGLEFKHGAGWGLRVLAPQIDRAVLRIDVGIPLNDVPGAETTVVAQFGQAFGVPSPAQ